MDPCHLVIDLGLQSLQASCLFLVYAADLGSQFAPYGL
jgi:hypothetical protein